MTVKLVEPTVIVYNPEGSVLLFNREGRGAVTGRRCNDVAFLQVFLEVLIEGFLFFRR